MLGEASATCTRRFGAVSTCQGPFAGYCTHPVVAATPCHARPTSESPSPAPAPHEPGACPRPRSGSVCTRSVPTPAEVYGSGHKCGPWCRVVSPSAKTAPGSLTAQTLASARHIPGTGREQLRIDGAGVCQVERRSARYAFLWDEIYLSGGSPALSEVSESSGPGRTLAHPSHPSHLVRDEPAPGPLAQAGTGNGRARPSRWGEWQGAAGRCARCTHSIRRGAETVGVWAQAVLGTWA